MKGAASSSTTMTNHRTAAASSSDNRNSHSASNRPPPTDEPRMLRLYEQIAVACATRQVETLTRLYGLVRPYAFTDQQAFKFDLFDLDSSVLDKLEEVLVLQQHASTTASSTVSVATNGTRRDKTPQPQSTAPIENQRETKKNKLSPSTSTFTSSASSSSPVVPKLKAAMANTAPGSTTAATSSSKFKSISNMTNAAAVVVNEATKS
jgi:hypothetical protein